MTDARADTPGTQGMAPEQHLYSDVIYRINSVLRSIIDEDPRFYEDNKIQLWPFQFDSLTRRFRWLLVRDEDWLLNENLLEAIRQLPEAFRTQWEEEKANKWPTLAETWPEVLDKGDPDFGMFAGEQLPTLWDRVLESSGAAIENPGAAHRAIMRLIAGRSFPCDEFHEGLVLKKVKAGARERRLLDRMHSTPLKTDDGSFPTTYQQVLSFYDDCGEPDSEDKEVIAVSSTWQALLQAAFARQTDIRHLITIPIYDGDRTTEQHGRLVGIIYGAILGEGDRECIGKEIADRVRPHKREIRSAFRAADLARIANQTLTQEDRDPEEGMPPPLHHFLHVLPMLQDWCRVGFRKGDHDDIFWWTRDQGTWQAKRAKPTTSAILSAGLSVLEMTRGVATWMSDEERDSLEGWQTHFEYPDYAVLPPPDSAELAVLERQYWQEQIDIWAIVLPKVLLRLRSEREAARVATSAIMGRNLSHNIGSHVLARYARKIGLEDKVKDHKEPEHRHDFLAYLQRRMDFLADVATSDRAFWYQSLSLEAELEQLNWASQVARLKQNNGEPVLLRFITGKEDLKATVDFQGDVQFASPNGEVGVQALFVILENIVRNSARHGNAPCDNTVRLTVRVKEHDRDLLRVEVVDHQSPIQVHSRNIANAVINPIIDSPILDSNGQPDPNNWGIREMQICAHYLRGSSLYDLQNPRENGPAALEAFADDGNLAYRFHLKRAKSMAVIIDQEMEVDGTVVHDKIAEGIGIRLLRWDDIPRDDCSYDWKTIGKETLGFDFLVVEQDKDRSNKDMTTPPTGGWERAAAGLPMRTLDLFRREIEELFRAALSGSANWTGPLHERWMKSVRDKRETWKGRPLYGLLVDEDCDDKWPDPVPTGGGLLRTRKCLGVDTAPLPPGSKRFLSCLDFDSKLTKRAGVRRGVAAAAWVDHAKRADFRQGEVRFVEARDRTTRPRAQRAWISVESVRSGDPERHLFDQVQNGEGTVWEILAAAASRVAVLDERVQSALADKSRIDGLSVRELQRLAGVWTPSKKDCDLDRPTMEKCREFLKRPSVLEEQFPVDCLILHLTVLEQLKNKAGKTLDQTLTCLIDDTHAADAEIVIVTGRGVPAVAQSVGAAAGSALDGVRFLPISALLASLTRPSKLALMRTIWASGTPERLTR